MLESKFQSELIEELKQIFVGCIVLKNDANYLQGFPDLIVLYKSRWAVLECKASFFAPYRPNQEFYLDLLGEMSYAAMICPENKEDVLNELYQALRARRTPRSALAF